LRKDEARTIAREAISLQSFDEAKSAKRVFAGMSAARDDVLASLGKVHENGRKGAVTAEPVVEGFTIRTATMDLLNRADVSVDASGALKITSPGNPGRGAENLETISTHLADKTMLDRSSPELRNLVENLVATTVRAGVDRQAGALVEAAAGRRFDVEAFSGTPERLSLTFRVSPALVRVDLHMTAPVVFGDRNEPIGRAIYDARVEYARSVTALSSSGDDYRVETTAQEAEFVCGDRGSDLGKSAGERLDDEVLQRAAQRPVAQPPAAPVNYGPGTNTSQQRVLT